MIENLNGTREIVDHADDLKVRLYINNLAENYPMHWHTDIEIIMALENNYTIVIDKTKYVINQGDIIIIPSGEIHELFAPPSGKRIIILVDNSILSSMNGLESISSSFYPCIIVRADSDSCHKQLVDILKKITEEYFHRVLLCQASIYSLFISFFVIIGRNCIKRDRTHYSAKRNKQHQYIDKFLNVCKYINEHCTEEITVEKLAAMAGFSKYHFSRLFYEFSGVSYYEYLMKRRIMHAESLLSDPNLTIVEVAMQSGFNSLATFNRNFRTIKKCTPSAYRSMHNSRLMRRAPLSGINLASTNEPGTFRAE
jgi:AraC-like DNA-binding protein